MLVECMHFYCSQLISAEFAGLVTLKPSNDAGNENEGRDLDLPLVEFEEIARATNNFSLNNKLGEGGFGPVYKVCTYQDTSILLGMSS